MLFLIVDQIDMLANRIFFIRKSLSPYISSRPRLSRCKSAKFKRIPSQYTSIVTFTIHTTRYFDRLYAQRRSATCYIYHLYPHLYPTLYVYEFYEILISPWEIITLVSVMTIGIRPNSFNTPRESCSSKHWYSRFGESVK